MKLTKAVLVAMTGLMVSGAMAQTCPVGQYYDDCNHTYAGPGPCIPGCKPDPNYDPTDPIGPDSVCIRKDCYPVQYEWMDRCVIANAKIGTIQYQVLGWAGPCLSDVNSDCLDIKNQAHRDLLNNVLRVNRAWDVE